MFQRRTRLPLRDRILNHVWPRMGWRRALSYLRFRLMRMPGTPHSIATGLAAGVAMSITPILGIHALCGIALAWALDGSLVAAAIGSLFGNPWFMAMIVPMTYRLGSLMLLRDPLAGDAVHLTISETLHHPGAVLGHFALPTFLGCIPIGLLLYWLFYLSAKRLITEYRHARHQRIAHGKARHQTRSKTAAHRSAAAE